MMRRFGFLIVVAVILAACGESSDAGDADPGLTSSPPPTPGATTTEVPVTTGMPAPAASLSPVTTAPVAEQWTRVVMEPPVLPGCCEMPDTGPVSPGGEIADVAWPADGVYSLTVSRLVEPPATFQATISRWVSCDELPNLCPPDSPDGGITADPASAVSRRFGLDEIASVVLWPIADSSETVALVGSGPAFTELLSEIDRAYMEWVLAPYQEGVSVADIAAELQERSADPAFQFARDDYTGVTAYRGPHGSLLVAEPGWLLEADEEWPPGYNGLYGWWPTLEIRGGEAILHVHAGIVAG